MASSLRAWFVPAPDSVTARNIRRGRPAWMESIHLLWSAWVFITPIFDSYTRRWALLTLLTYPIFLLLYAKCLLASRSDSWRYALGLVAMCMLLLPWYPSGLSYFIYGCLMLNCTRIAMNRYFVLLIALNVACMGEALLLHYAWQTLIAIPVSTFILGVVINAERLNDEKDVELRLSHDEVRRLAATAERERIGRDLHDLLGHTLSLITLKLELSRKLFDRDHAAARRELEEAERVARHALAEVRSAVTGIRATDLAAELASARLLLESSAVQLDYGSLPASVPVEIERGLALVLREAVTNIARHAQATRAQVSLTVVDGVARMCVEDNGRGGVTAHGNGLGGMRERVRTLGGMLDIDSPAGHGTLVRVSVPLVAERRMPLSPRTQSTDVERGAA